MRFSPSSWVRGAGTNTMSTRSPVAPGLVLPQVTGMRVFLGFPASDAIRSFVHRVQTALRSHGVGGKWVAPSRTHWTVLFLGDQAPEAVERFGERLSSAVPSAQAPVLECTGIGAFSSRPRLLFLGWDEAIPGPFASLVALTERCAAAAAIPIDPAGATRKAQPHLTLVRFRGARESRTVRPIGGLREGRWVWRIELPSPPPEALRFVCDRLVLYQSHLGPAGPVYETLREFRLDTAERHNEADAAPRGLPVSDGNSIEPRTPCTAQAATPSPATSAPGDRTASKQQRKPAASDPTARRE